MISTEHKWRGISLKKAWSASMVTPLPKEEECTERTNGTVVKRARFVIENVRHPQQIPAVNLSRWWDSSIAVKEGSQRLFSDVPVVKGKVDELSERVLTIANHLKFRSTDLKMSVEFNQSTCPSYAQGSCQRIVEHM
jgi:hypothetical protein